MIDVADVFMTLLGWMLAAGLIVGAAVIALGLYASIQEEEE